VPDADLAQVQAIWYIVRDYGNVLTLWQLLCLAQISSNPNVIIAWSASALAANFEILQAIYNKEIPGGNGKKKKSHSQVQAGKAMQPLVDRYTELLQAGDVQQWKVVNFISTCSVLNFIPVSLLLFLYIPGNFRSALLGWVEVLLLLVAFGALGLGRHSEHDQMGMIQPVGLIRGVLFRARALLAEGRLPATYDDSRTICQAVAYIADEEGVPILQELAEDADVPNPARTWSLHKLWRAGTWLRAFKGIILPVTWLGLNYARDDSNRSTQASPPQRELQSLLVSIHDRFHGAYLTLVSACEHRLEDFRHCADVYVETWNGLRIVFEFDGNTHFVGPYRGLSGATMWRNFVLRWAGYQVISISSDEWVDAANREQMVLAKLRHYAAIPA
jgi:hypothetical protein